MTSHFRPFLDDGVQVYVVSLRDAVLRRANVEAGIGAAGLKYRFIDAIDGDHASSVRAAYRCEMRGGERFYIHRDPPVSQRELACALSHARAIMAAHEAGEDGVLIVEDDVELLCRDLSVLRGVIDAAPADAAYLQFQISPTRTIERLYQRFAETGDLFLEKQRTPSTSFVDPALSDTSCHGGAAYFVSRHAMKALSQRYIDNGVVLFPCQEEEVSSNMALVADKFIYWALSDDRRHGYACTVPMFTTIAIDSYLHEDRLPRMRQARSRARDIFEQYHGSSELPR